MLNEITIQGRFVSNPEMKQTTGGTSFAKFAVACDRDMKGPDGEKRTDFFDCVAWGKTADAICKYMSKGRLAIVKGRLEIRHWQAQDGTKRKSAEIVAREFYFCDSKPKETEDYKPVEFTEVDASDGELPF